MNTGNTIHLEWSNEQCAALDAIRNWYLNSAAQIFLLEGPAGCGKTTLIREIGHILGGIRVVYATFTGKAASVMRAKGCANADTIHAAIYMPQIAHRCEAKPPCDAPPCAKALEGRCPHVREIAEGYILNPNSAVAAANLVVIDEVSMVNAINCHPSKVPVISQVASLISR
jgi:Mesyanzhinovviridae Dda-like helicase